MWNNETLADAFAAQFDAATDLVSECQAKLNDPRLIASEAKIAEMLSSAQALVSASQELLDDLAASGIYVIGLSPGAGGWPSRLQNAANAPVNDPGLITAIFASIFVAPTVESVESAYGSMKSALTSPMRIQKPTIPTIEKPVLVAEGDSEWIAEDQWETATVGDFASAQLVAAKNSMNAAQDALTMAQNAKAAFDAKKLKLIEALDEANAVLASLGNTGVYTVMLTPAVGGWLSRMIGEPGVPPMGAEYYSAGSVTVIQAADMATVLSRWNSLMGAIQ